MTCPSCTYKNPSGVRFCGRCRMSFNARSLFLVRFRDHLFWILRRSNSGFMSGLVAWFFIPALSRVLSQNGSVLLHFFVTGFLGGAFLGSVDGMIEESSPKTVKGGLLGGLGGGVGGLLFGASQSYLSPEQMIWGLCIFWGIAGSAVGIVSAHWERQPKKLFFGALAGFIGGAIGGGLGYSMYSYLLQEFNPERWFVRRLFEGLSGGIIGISLWFAIGLAERFIIFKRRLVEGKDHKVCDHCDAKSPLSAWYCNSCGSVLQQSAPPASLNLSPFTTLDRLCEMFRFLSRLSVTTGVIAGFVTFVVFVPANPFLAFVALVLVAVASYSLLLLFSACAESLQIFMKKN